jgi:hypothetical protein
MTRKCPVEKLKQWDSGVKTNKVKIAIQPSWNKFLHLIR